MHDRLEHLFARFCDQGDAAALGEVFDTCAARLLRIARHVAHDAGEAEDLVQASFLAAIEKRASFERSRKLEPWLIGILLKQASLARRARARVIEPERLCARGSEDPLLNAGARELSEALTVALARLSPGDRDVLIPLLLDGRRAVEIARELGRRPDTVHMSIHRGLARLRRLLPASLALALASRSASARGLSAVRMQVLRHARAELGIPGATSAALAAGTLGVAMSMKKSVLAAVVIGLGLLLGGSRFFGGAGEPPRSGSERALASLDLSQGSVAQPMAKPSLAGASERIQVPQSQQRPSPAGFELLLLREEGGPAAAARVALVDDAGQVVGAHADAQGVCAFAPRAGTVQVFVSDDGRLPFHARLESAAAERRTLLLPRAETLAGRLRLSDGGELPSFELELDGDSAPEGFVAASKEVFRALELMRYGRPQFHARMQTHADGSFQFQGLPPGWTGSLCLPLEFVFVFGEKRSTGSVCKILASSQPVDLTIAWRPRILGRLVEKPSGAALAKVQFDGALQWSDGGSMLVSTQTDDQGRFLIPLDYRDDAIGLSLQGIHCADGRTAEVERSAKWSGPCEPFDAGDFECAFPAARALEFQVRDAAGIRLSGARAAIDREESIAADATGVGVLAAVPLDAQELRVVAPGYAIARLALTPQTASPLVVVLAPANRLSLQLPRGAQERRDLYVELVSRPLLFGGKTRMYDVRLRGGMIGTCSSADGDSGTKLGSVRLRFSEQGRIEVEDLLSGVPFLVRLHGGSARDAPLCEIAIDALAPTEQRLIEFSAASLDNATAHTVRGSVEDEQGRPLLDARIATCFSCGLSCASSAADGSFRFESSGEDPLDIEVSKRGFVPFRVRAWDPRAGKPLRARLLRGMDLRVELVDAQGREVEGASIAAEVTDFGTPGRIEGGPPGVFTLCDLPPGSVRVIVRVAGRAYAQDYDTGLGSVRMLLPEHARLSVHWNWSEPPSPQADYRLALRPLDASGEELIGWTPFAERVLDHEFPSVLPGEYTLVLEVASPNASGSETQYTALHAPQRLSLVGGQSARVELSP